jgi:3-polyprenyl-4-hydroxybenzoate decarboxylase
MVTLTQNLQGLADAVGDECKALRVLINGNDPNLADLTTTNKTNLVAAVNELKLLIEQTTAVDDAQTATDTTWSSTKITQAIDAAVTSILGGSNVPAALDTIAEIAQTISQSVVRVDAAQSFTTTQMATARANIQAVAISAMGDPETDFVALFNQGLL